MPDPAPNTDPAPSTAPAAFGAPEEPRPGGHVRVEDILAEQGITPPSGGRRRRRYREDDEPDDVLARILGRN